MNCSVMRDETLLPNMWNKWLTYEVLVYLDSIILRAVRGSWGRDLPSWEKDMPF